MNFDTLYKRDTTGRVRVWSMEQDGCRHRVISGSEGGSLTTSGWTTCAAKRGTTPETQAAAEIQSAYTKKLEKDYFRSIEDIDTVLFTKPMLAQTYEKVSFPVASQPKLDGMRCIARKDGLWSRTGKRITTVPHIAKALAPVFEKSPDLILDGEIYNHAMKDNFGELMSLARGGDPEGMLEYHIYDVVLNEVSFERRFADVYKLISHPLLCIVDAHTVHSQGDLDRLNVQWLAEGYEGQMVRILARGYENKRSKFLLKRKEFLSAEFPVAGIHSGEGNWDGYAKRFTLGLPDGREFGAGVRGTQAALKALLAGPVPSWATIRYFTPTPDGIPRFPVVTDWGFGQRED
jgi:DNA ligase-1